MLERQNYRQTEVRKKLKLLSGRDVLKEAEFAPAVVEPTAPQRATDRALVQSVIDGTVPDILSAELGEALIAAYERNEHDPEFIAFIEQAMDIYERETLAAEIPQ